MMSAVKLVEFSRYVTKAAADICAPGVPLVVIGQTIEYVHCLCPSVVCAR
jgi:hypothetical protein